MIRYKLPDDSPDPEPPIELGLRLMRGSLSGLPVIQDSRGYNVLRFEPDGSITLCDGYPASSNGLVVDFRGRVKINE